LCAGALMTAGLGVAVYTDVFDLGFDDTTRQLFTALLGVAAVFDLVMARVMYQRISAKK
jgi:hypothetical protein